MIYESQKKNDLSNFLYCLESNADRIIINKKIHKKARIRWYIDDRYSPDRNPTDPLFSFDECLDLKRYLFEEFGLEVDILIETNPDDAEILKVLDNQENKHEIFLEGYKLESVHPDDFIYWYKVKGIVEVIDD